MAYVLPQVQVFQIFNQLPQNVVRNLNAFVFGPHYQLFRYAEAAEKAGIELGPYVASASTDYTWPGLLQNMTVDTTYAKLYADDVWAEYLTLDADYNATVKAEDERNKIRVPSIVFKSGNGFDRAEVLLRDVRAGDTVAYSFTDIDGEHAGTSRVVSVEADVDADVVNEPVAKAANIGSQVATEAVTASDTNVNLFTGTVGSIGASTEYPGHLGLGVVADTITVTVTTTGAAGAAYATVASAATGVTRTAVPIEAAGADGRIYIGDNMYVEFTADSTATFTAGDVFTVEVESTYAAVTGGAVIDSGSAQEATAGEVAAFGSFTGARTTTYAIEVVRGGLFDRAVNVADGVTQASGNTLAAAVGSTVTPNWNAWYGGDRDDEYVVKCTTAGTVANARFSVTSAAGDNTTGLALGTSADAAIGSMGLVGRLTGAGSFTLGDTFIIRVNACRPRVRVTDTSALDSTVYAVVAANTPFGLGLLGAEAVFGENTNTEDGSGTTGGLVKGDIYYVSVEPETASAYRTLVLADDVDAAIAATDVLDALTLFTVQQNVLVPMRRSQEPGVYNWELQDEGTPNTGFTVTEGMQVQDSSWVMDDGTKPWLPVYSADLYMEYRGLLSNYADTIRAIEDISAVETTFGTVTPDNPLAQGVYNAMLNSGNRAVYYMAVPSTDMTGWSAVMDRATLNNDVYAFVPLTQDEAVLELVEGHVDQMSTPTEKHWRIGFVSAAMPVEDPIYTAASNPAGVPYKAKIIYDAVTEENTKLVFVDDDGDPVSDLTSVLADVKIGDKVRISFSQDVWGDTTYAEFEVAALLSNNSLRLESGPASEIDVGEKVEVYHPYSRAEQADAYAAKAYSFYNHRIYNVFPPTFSSNGVLMTGEFAAAIVAGLASSVAPQQPITNVEVNGIDDVPMVYQTFNKTQLNKMAEYGTLILMQDMAGGLVYVRHQVSTRAKEGNLNKTELSIVKNFDSVSFYFAARFAPYIGRYNITPKLINVIEGILEDGLAFLGSMTDLGLLGPQILLAETEIVSVVQHPELADHIICEVNIGLPKPFNVLQLKLVV